MANAAESQVIRDISDGSGAVGQQALCFADAAFHDILHGRYAKFTVKGADFDMAVFRVEKNRGYTVMSNHHLRNKALSLKAKGLLSQMLSLPEDWDYTLKGLSLINRESYLLLKIGAEKRYIAKNVIIYIAEQVARILFSEVSMDVLQMTGNDHTEQTADPLELAEIKRRWNPYIDQLPEYAYICDDLLSGRK